jgi:phenylalanyl-tRNA synthetase beta subunit
VATSNDRTLTDGEITQAVTTIAQRAAKTLAAERV